MVPGRYRDIRNVNGKIGVKLAKTLIRYWGYGGGGNVVGSIWIDYNCNRLKGLEGKLPDVPLLPGIDPWGNRRSGNVFLSLRSS